jgi:hypothetical protein
MVAISDEVLFADEEVMVIIQLPKLQETILLSADERCQQTKGPTSNT